jgi:predicted regulator of Ras-like GTPase activity (Roadblock/LC7/MglB family)
VGALEDAALARSGQIVSHLGFGELRHAAFDGTVRSVHAWSEGERSALIVMATGGSTSLVAARCTKAFQVIR